MPSALERLKARRCGECDTLPLPAPFRPLRPLWAADGLRPTCTIITLRLNCSTVTPAAATAAGAAGAAASPATAEAPKHAAATSHRAADAYLAACDALSPEPTQAEPPAPIEQSAPLAAPAAEPGPAPAHPSACLRASPWRTPPAEVARLQLSADRNLLCASVDWRRGEAALASADHALLLLLRRPVAPRQGAHALHQVERAPRVGDGLLPLGRRPAGVRGHGRARLPVGRCRRCLHPAARPRRLGVGAGGHAHCTCGAVECRV